MVPLAQGQLASTWQSWDLNLGPTGPGSVLPGTEIQGGLDRPHWPGWTAERNKSLSLKSWHPLSGMGSSQKQNYSQGKCCRGERGPWCHQQARTRVGVGWGTVLCIKVCLTASWASTHDMPVVPSPPCCDNRNVSQHCPMSPGCQNCS